MGSGKWCIQRGLICTNERPVDHRLAQHAIVGDGECLEGLSFRLAESVAESQPVVVVGPFSLKRWHVSENITSLESATVGRWDAA